MFDVYQDIKRFNLFDSIIFSVCYEGQELRRVMYENICECQILHPHGCDESTLAGLMGIPLKRVYAILKPEINKGMIERYEIARDRQGLRLRQTQQI